MEEITVKLSSYELEWLENAIDRDTRGQPIDQGTLATLGNILITGAQI